MVVAQVIGDLRVGGAERLFIDLVNSLQCERKLAFFLNNSNQDSGLASCLDHGIERRIIPIRKRSAVFEVLRLARAFRDTGCHVVHTHMFWANLYGTVAAAIADIPVIITSEHGRNEWKRPWHRWIEARVISRFADRRLCVSQEILERRRDIDGVPEHKLLLIPNGTKVPPMVCQEESEEIVIGSVGRLVTQKDYPTLVRAVSLLVNSGLECRLCIVGDGPDRSSIQETIEQLGIQHLVDLAGCRADVDLCLNSWSVFVNSSIQEGQPIALLEAMARGLPCVATAVGGVPDTIEHGKEGIIVPPGRPDALAQAIRKLADNRELRARLGKAARERVSKDFSIEALADRCLGVYQSVLKAKVG